MREHYNGTDPARRFDDASRSELAPDETATDR
jgi:hypothetical protein